jgi:hypothetical protein
LGDNIKQLVGILMGMRVRILIDFDADGEAPWAAFWYSKCEEMHVKLFRICYISIAIVVEGFWVAMMVFSPTLEWGSTNHWLV